MTTKQMQADMHALSLRLVATDMAQLHAGLVKMGNMDALAEKLEAWIPPIVKAERFLKVETGGPSHE